MHEIYIVLYWGCVAFSSEASSLCEAAGHLSEAAHSPWYAEQNLCHSSVQANIRLVLVQNSSYDTDKEKHYDAHCSVDYLKVVNWRVTIYEIRTLLRQLSRGVWIWHSRFNFYWVHLLFYQFSIINQININNIFKKLIIVIELHPVAIQSLMSWTCVTRIRVLHI